MSKLWRTLVFFCTLLRLKTDRSGRYEPSQPLYRCESITWLRVQHVTVTFGRSRDNHTAVDWLMGGLCTVRRNGALHVCQLSYVDYCSVVVILVLLFFTTTHFMNRFFPKYFFFYCFPVLSPVVINSRTVLVSSSLLLSGCLVSHLISL